MSVRSTCAGRLRIARSIEALRAGSEEYDFVLRLSTRGRRCTSGARTIRIHGEDVLVAAEVRNIDALSAHADADEIIEWLKSARMAPRTFITHGELRAAQALQGRIAKDWDGPASCLNEVKKQR